MQKIVTEGKDVAEPDPIGSGAMYSNRIIPRTGRLSAKGSVAGEPTVIIHEVQGGEPAYRPVAYNRCNAVICEAMRVLEQWKYIPVRISRSSVPFDLIGLGTDGALVLHIVRSRRPVPDARTVYRVYRREVDYLRMIGTSPVFRKMIWVYSPQCGWRLYDVYPGGLRLALDMMDSINK